jgi:hypothetical protein
LIGFDPERLRGQTKSIDNAVKANTVALTPSKNLQDNPESKKLSISPV